MSNVSEEGERGVPGGALESLSRSVPLVAFASLKAGLQLAIRKRWVVPAALAVVALGVVPMSVGFREGLFQRPTVVEYLRREVRGQGEVVPANSEAMFSPFVGREARIRRLVLDGAIVRRGELLAEFDASDLERELQDLDLQTVEIQAGLDQMKRRRALSAIVGASEISTAESSLALSQDELENYGAYEAGLKELELAGGKQSADQELSRLRERLEAVEELFARGFASRTELETAKAEMVTAEVRSRQAAEQLRYFIEVERPLEHEKRRSRVRELEKELAKLKAASSTGAADLDTEIGRLSAQLEASLGRRASLRQQVDRATMTAPEGGVVVLERVRDPVNAALRPLREGDSVWGGQLVLRVASLGALELVIRVPEGQLREIQPGLEALVRLAAAPQEPIEAEVRSIGTVQAASDEEVALRRAVEVRLSLAKAPDWVRPSMTGYAVIALPPERDALLVPLTAVQFEGEESFLEIKSLFGSERRAVVLGGAVGPSVVVHSGLSAEERVRVDGRAD